MDLAADTARALDWPVVLEALATRARTPMGQAACRALRPLDREGIDRAHAGLAEVLSLYQAGTTVRLGDIADVLRLADRASKGDTLDGPDLRTVGFTLTALTRLAHGLLDWPEDLPVLQGEAALIVLDDGLVETLEEAFDPQGQLSADLWPVLGELRERIRGLHAGIRRALDDILQRDDMQDLLQDKFVTQRRERYVVPVKARAKRWDLGIVHGTSASGATVYIEPGEVVQLNNQLQVAEGELAAEEQRIRAQLSRWIGTEYRAIGIALEAASRIDVITARADLAVRLDATRPIVGDDGVVALKQARHPVLLLRDIDVIPNDLTLSSSRPALVLSGPNAGGKTVALKTVGLCALLARIGCWIPAAEGSRIDRFPSIHASVGDAQSIEGDLSSFSGHLLVLREMLAATGPGTLLLLDEIATGTDPAQGAALARAILEDFVARGARAVVTTHYAQLKGLATTDPRFAVAAMEYDGELPTYRVVHGATGESHAFGIAQRMGLDPGLIQRARGFLGQGELAFTEALEALEAKKTEAEAASRRARKAELALAEERRTVAERERKLRERAKELEKQQAAEFIDRLKRAEKAISAVVADLQRAPSHQAVQRARATVEALRELVPRETPEEVEVVEAPIGPGDTVRLAKLGKQGEVLTITGDTAQVRTGGLTVKVKLRDLERTSAAPQAAPVPTVRFEAAPKTDLDDAVRYDGNTADLRGMRVDEALLFAEQFCDRATRSQMQVVFFLHGHGTGALKQAVREWVRETGYIRKAQPANADQGGDAYTVASLA